MLVLKILSTIVNSIYMLLWLINIAKVDDFKECVISVIFALLQIITVFVIWLK